MPAADLAKCVAEEQPDVVARLVERNPPSLAGYAALERLRPQDRPSGNRAPSSSSAACSSTHARHARASRRPLP